MRALKTLAVAAATLALSTTAALAQTIAITNGRVLTGTGTIDRGTVVIRDGRIAAVGPAVAVPAGAEVIDAAGGVIAPGFVAVDSGLGGIEVSALQDTNDLRQSSNSLSAAFDLSWGLDPDSFTLPVARLGGITRAIVVPQHPGSSGGHVHEDDTAGVGEGGLHSPGLFAGQAAAIHLAEGTDILVQPRIAMVAPFGDAGAGVAGGARGAEFTLFREILREVRLYAANRAAYDRGNLRDLMLSRADLEALIPVAQGRMPLIISVHRAADIRNVLRLAQEEGLDIILDGAEEGWRVADEIAAAGVPVLINPLANLPQSFEVRGATMENAARLHAAGVVIAIKGNEGSVHRARETRYNAGNAVAHGLPYEAAIAAITVNPARIFGLESRFGGIRTGAAADVVVWTGDPLEPLSQPTAIFIEGRRQPLNSRALELRDRYQTRTPLPPAYRN
ncbi:amidohydrolase family protein [Brevundimonas aveniformis]|uniref:amidohydrolase family protein n=1 Tax=Brevundimonas aveniformis TaxID=370977 RepID=UPI00040C7311|nr:amidohydrolase family protein [Brevundimonas aveniformis]